MVEDKNWAEKSKTKGMWKTKGLLEHYVAADFSRTTSILYVALTAHSYWHGSSYQPLISVFHLSRLVLTPGPLLRCSLLPLHAQSIFTRQSRAEKEGGGKEEVLGGRRFKWKEIKVCSAFSCIIKSNTASSSLPALATISLSGFQGIQSTPTLLLHSSVLLRPLWSPPPQQSKAR